VETTFGCASEPFAHGLPRGKRVRWNLLGGKRLNNLARRDVGLSRDGVNTEFAFFEKLLVGHRLTKLATSSSTEIVEQSFRKSSNFPVAEPSRPATAATPAFGSNAEAFRAGRSPRRAPLQLQQLAELLRVDHRRFAGE